MTTDKIRLAIGEYLWTFWQNNNDPVLINKAYDCLKHEIEIGLRRDTKDFAEFELLCMKTDRPRHLDLR